MKAIASELQAHLDSGATTLAWCWRITRSDGAVLGFTDHDHRISFAGTDFEPESGFSASELRAGSDLAVDAQDAEGVLTSDRITEADILDGRWDNAAVELWRANWNAVSQRVLMRQGAIGQIRRGRTSFVAEARSLAHLLDQTVGRTFQHACDAALGDSRCKVALSDSRFSGAGAVTSVLRDRVFTASGLAGFANDLFSAGVLEWSSGANAERKAEVLTHVVAAGQVTIALLEAPVRPIATGDGFKVEAGCDKTAATCHARFGNILNFRGFPHVPGQEAVTRYAVAGKGHAGAPL